MTNKKNVFSILLLVIIVFSVWGFSSSEKDNNPFSKKVKIALREVGNQLLLSELDTVSLILPVKEIAENKYQLSFEKPLAFEPSVLVLAVKNVFKKSDFSKNYLVEVLQCSNNEVAYSYQIKNESEKNIIPCSGRVLPINCYKIEVFFLDKSVSKFNYNILFYIFIPLIIGILYSRFSKNKEKEIKIENTHEKQTILGSFIFYPEQNKLVQKAKEISLSKKECELLAIFVANPNTIIKREELTKKVWEDHGVFVGRSLDTYISKLRKKLKEDTSIKLINIHGVGYKLEINL